MFTGSASAGPWNIEPSVGASADYESNPGLHTIDVHAEERVAALVDVPLRYDTNGIEFTLRPSGRLSNSSGYASIASNYIHVDTSAQFINDLSTLSWQGGLARDSSLFFVGGLENGIGVRRDTASTAIDWTRTLTERNQLELDANWSEVRYDQPPNETGLTNYRYLSGGPTWNFAVTERTTLKLLGDAGHYQSLNGITESKSYSLQTGFVRKLSELWSVTATAGYTRSNNSEKYYYGPFFVGTVEYGPFYLGTIKSNQNSTVYAITLTRQGERFNLTGGASRLLQPTGFAYLSRVDSISANATFTQSERWDYGMSAVWERAQNPLLGGAPIDVRYINAQLTANWHWTPQWVMTLNLGRISQQYSSSAVTPTSNGVIISVSRRFLRTEL